MARLGKRERSAKRALIASNLANYRTLERSSGSMGSTIREDRLLSNAHTLGCHVGASEGRMGPRKVTRGKRWGDA